jgi:hypothetical protein
MLQHSEKYDWYVTVGDIDVDTATQKIDGHPRGKAVYFDCYDDAFTRAVKVGSWDNKNYLNY